jgi:hypothetical protein
MAWCPVSHPAVAEPMLSFEIPELADFAFLGPVSVLFCLL